jgi:N-acyl homoserine lactone hydrolase
VCSSRSEPSCSPTVLSSWAGRGLPPVPIRFAGLEPARARWVIISHLHEDHIGVAESFAGASFVGGVGTAGKVPGLSAPRWREVTFNDSRALPPFDASIDLFGDGSVVLLRGGGHAREDIMALLALPDGPVLLTGDAVVHREWLDSDDVELVAVDSQRAADVRNQVRALLAARPDVPLLPGHDLQSAPRARGDVTLHHPEWFTTAAWPLSP